MVIDDHHIHAPFPGQLQGFESRDSIVHGDDQPCPLLQRLCHPLRLEAVPVGVPVRNQIVARRPYLFQKIHEQRRAGDAIDIVVAEDDDLLSPPDGPFDPLDPWYQIGQQFRRMKGFGTHLEIFQAQLSAGQQGIYERVVVVVVEDFPNRIQAHEFQSRVAGDRQDRNAAIFLEYTLCGERPSRFQISPCSTVRVT